MKDINREISRLICLAQAASDSGKEIFRIKMKDPELETACRLDYKAKAIYEKRAIALISKNRNSIWNFYIGQDNIVYFFCQIDGRDIQISFHNPMVGGLTIGRGKATRWDHWRNGSVNNVYFLIKKYAL